MAAVLEKGLLDACQSKRTNLLQQLTKYSKNIDLAKLTVQLKIL